MAQMATKARRRPISPADGRIQYACNSRPMMGTSYTQPQQQAEDAQLDQNAQFGLV